jgi:hypothetical protein
MLAQRAPSVVTFARESYDAAIAIDEKFEMLGYRHRP